MDGVLQKVVSVIIAVVILFILPVYVRSEEHTSELQSQR